MKFQLKSNYQPTGDQPEAIQALVAGLDQDRLHQTLLGVTGSGKTFTVANVIKQTQLPTLVIAHNKTLAAQLYQELRDFFPNNAVTYFVSYYDYYQPEAYIPSTDTYIEKEAQINDEIDKLRLAATTNLLTRNDVIVVASVSCIYNLGNPVEYGQHIFEMIEGELIAQKTLLLQLANLQYQRSDIDFRRGTFRVRGDTIQVWPAYTDTALKIDTLENKIVKIQEIDPLSGAIITNPEEQQAQTDYKGRYLLFPAKHYLIDPKTQENSLAQIKEDLKTQLEKLKKQNKQLEAYRLNKKVKYDLEMIREFGFVNGIENYSRYFDGRSEGEPPFTLIDYFQENARKFNSGTFLTVIDESHMTLPQIRGMYFGDRSRKETLIEYGFRLPSALDNRPLTFDEFLEKTRHKLYVSATPKDWEIKKSKGRIVEQLVRPTGLLDPIVELRSTESQIRDLIVEIVNRVAKGQRVLVTTLTKRMAEDLTDFLNDEKKINKLLKQQQKQPKKSEKNITYLPVEQMKLGKMDKKYLTQAQIDESLFDNENSLTLPKVAYLHSEIETLDRSDILDELRQGKFDVLVGINLLREGLDLPEVNLVAILDADKTGFLRSDTALIQTMGRAARHQEGRAILYADNLSKAMQDAISETQRRRKTQEQYNQNHDITPTSIQKPIREKLLKREKEEDLKAGDNPSSLIVQLSAKKQIDLAAIQADALTPQDKKSLSKKLVKRMNQAAKELDYELAAILRDKIEEIQR
ncbi:MAG: UvrABC system protein B [Microgenomates bacterium 39_7]|nr:MAG: UvrABC system protein B [Microgenomates bacterium 39_7]